MKNFTTIKSIRYQVTDSSGTVLDVFNQKTSAISSAFSFASEFRGDKFAVIKKSCNKEIKVFEITMQMNFKFLDAKSVFEGIEKASANKKNKITGLYKKEN
jgi:hypothetical protein